MIWQQHEESWMKKKDKGIEDGSPAKCSVWGETAQLHVKCYLLKQKFGSNHVTTKCPTFWVKTAGNRKNVFSASAGPDVVLYISKAEDLQQANKLRWRCFDFVAQSMNSLKV